MAIYDVSIGFDPKIVGNIELDDDATASIVARQLIDFGLLNESKFFGEFHLLPKKTPGTISLIDDSGFPYATLSKQREVAVKDTTTLGDIIKNQEEGKAKCESGPKCPACQSSNVERLNAVTRGAAAGLFGLFSSTARSQFICKNCGYKF